MNIQLQASKPREDKEGFFTFPKSWGCSTLLCIVFCDGLSSVRMVISLFEEYV